MFKLLVLTLLLINHSFSSEIVSIPLHISTAICEDYVPDQGCIIEDGNFQVLLNEKIDLSLTTDVKVFENEKQTITYTYKKGSTGTRFFELNETYTAAVSLNYVKVFHKVTGKNGDDIIPFEFYDAWISSSVDILLTQEIKEYQLGVSSTRSSGSESFINDYNSEIDELSISKAHFYRNRNGKDIFLGVNLTTNLY